MTSVAPAIERRRSTGDLVASIILLVVGFLVVVAQALVDVLLSLTTADSPGDVAGAVSTAFLLLGASSIVWIVGTVVAILLLARRRRARWMAVAVAIVPLACGVAGFVIVNSVVQ
jgi:hypothetical protein